MSSSVLELLQNSIDSSTGDHEYLKEYLESCLEHGVFYPKNNVELVVKTINTSLNNSFDKEKGLNLLLAFLPHISIDAFSSNAVSWMTHCIKSISQKGETVDDLSFKVLSKVIKLSVKFPEINRETAKEIVPKFLLDQVKRRSDLQISIELLECLQACMSEYSGPSGDFKTDILRLLLGVVERQRDVVGAAACCIPLVAQVGGGGKLGVSHKTSWRSLHLSFVTLLHTLLNKIYQHIDCLTEVETTPPENPALVLEPVTERNILFKTQRLAKQFVSVTRYLQALLLQEFPVAKSVAPDAILDVIGHAQKPTHSALGSSREALAVSSVLPSIQVAALHLLESLILCLGSNLVPRAGLINHLCSQVVVWTRKQHQDWPYAMDKPYSETRLAAYGCLQLWFTAVGAACGAESIVDKALPVLLFDIHTQKPTVRLKVGSKTSKGKKKQQMLVNVEDRSEKLGDSVANRGLCEQALLTLAQLVGPAAPHLKADTLMSIQDTVLTVSAELPVPYGAATCCSSLYQLLLALCLAPHPRVPPPLAPAIAVFTTGLHHPDPQVKATCSSALSSLEKIVHPMAATLYFPLPQESQKSLVRESTDEESESSETEEAESAAKKRRVEPVDDSASIVSIVLDDSDDNSSVKSLIVEVGEETLEVNISDDSLGTVELFSEESRPSDDAEITEGPVSEITVDVIEDTKVGSEIITTTSTNELEQRIKIDLSGSTNKIEVPGGTIKTESDVIISIPETDDAVVSQMLMDFNDEIDNDNEI